MERDSRFRCCAPVYNDQARCKRRGHTTRGFSWAWFCAMYRPAHGTARIFIEPGHVITVGPMPEVT